MGEDVARDPAEHGVPQDAVPERADQQAIAAAPRRLGQDCAPTLR